MAKRDQLGSDHALNVCSLLLIFSCLQQQLGLLLKLIHFPCPINVYETAPSKEPMSGWRSCMEIKNPSAAAKSCFSKAWPASVETSPSEHLTVFSRKTVLSSLIQFSGNSRQQACDPGFQCPCLNKRGSLIFHVKDPFLSVPMAKPSSWVRILTIGKVLAYYTIACLYCG